MERVKAITEDFLRVELRNTQPEVYYIPEGKILTPAAREYLQQRKIKVAAGGQPAEPAPAAAPAAQPVVPTVMCAPEPPKPKYVDYETGAYYMEKPEHMTQLFGNVLVAKDHPRIHFAASWTASRPWWCWIRFRSPRAAARSWWTTWGTSWAFSGR